MKKYLIFLFIITLFLIPSCKQNNITFIESSKVSCYEDLALSSRILYLNVYTSTNINDLKLKEHPNIECSDIIFKTRAKYIYNNEEIDSNFYQFKILLSNIQLSITHLTFINDDIEYSLDIGKYQLVKMPQLSNKITGVVNLTNNNQIYIYLHNDLDRTIYLNKVLVYLVNYSMLKLNKIICSEAYIYEGTTRIFKIGTIDIPQNLIMVSGFLKLEFKAESKEYVIYINYFYNRSIEV